ncbi:MAG: RNA polymerase sigma factor SigJ [Pseudomonadota bacterium]
MQDAIFEDHRPRLMALSYRMLGSHSDAEDAVQDVWLRWRAARQDELRDVTGWLVRVCGNICLDVLKSARRQRETYVGQWLPEPWMPVIPPDAEDKLILRDDLSQAYLLMLERLDPVERVALVLHEVFDWNHDAIAPVIDRTANNARQILFRARRKMADAIPGSPLRAADIMMADRDDIAAFIKAFGSGDVTRIMAHLAPDVTLHSDGGGKASAAVNRIYGADHVARFFAGIRRKAPAGYISEIVRGGAEYWLLLRMTSGEMPVTAISFRQDDTGLHDIFIHRNPDKIALFSRLAA